MSPSIKTTMSVNLLGKLLTLILYRALEDSEPELLSYNHMFLTKKIKCSCKIKQIDYTVSKTILTNNYD